MANISFGLDTNKYAQQTGFDQFQTGMFETLGEIKQRVQGCKLEGYARTGRQH